MVMNPTRTYILRTIFFMTGHVAINVAAIVGAFDNVEPPGKYLLALAVSAPVVGHIWSMLDYMRTADEFISGRTARTFIVATGLALALFTGWGFLETYADLPHAPGWMIYPLLWAMYGIASPFTFR